MPSLFGIDIAGIVATEIANAGGVLDITLASTVPGTRTPGDLAGGTNPTSVSIPCKGFLEKGSRRIQGQLQPVVGTFVSILGKTVSNGTVEPEVNWRATVEGTTFDLVELVERDPAAALFVFRAEAS